MMREIFSLFTLHHSRTRSENTAGGGAIKCASEMLLGGQRLETDQIRNFGSEQLSDCGGLVLKALEEPSERYVTVCRFRYRSINDEVRDAIKLIEDDGWFLVRMRGSHRQYKHARKPGLVTIAGKPSDELAPGTKNSILKQAGLK